MPTFVLISSCLLAFCAEVPGRARSKETRLIFDRDRGSAEGPRADVSNLTLPGREPHDIELTVQQTASVADADVVVYEKGFQAAVDAAVAQVGPAHAVDVSGPGRVVGTDPHFWLDPTRLGSAAAAIEREVAAADPKHATTYAANLATLQRQLAGLDTSFRTGLAHCRITTLVASHDAFGYLGRRYGLRVVGINGLSPDAEPSPAHIRQLQDLIRTDGITTVFSEQLASRALACSFSCCWRLMFSTRRRSDTSRMEPIHPVWRPLSSISGASNTSTGKRSPSARWKMVSKRGVKLPDSTLENRSW